MEENVEAQKRSMKRLVIVIGVSAAFAVALTLAELRAGWLGLFDKTLDEARAAVRIGDTDLALDKYRSYVMANLEDTGARRELIDLHIKRDELQQALRIGEQLIKDYPDTANISVYEEALKTILTQSERRQQAAIDAKNVSAFDAAIDQAQAVFPITPQVVLEQALGKESTYNLPYPEILSFPDMSLARWKSELAFIAPVFSFLDYELIRGTEKVLEFGLMPRDVLNAEAIRDSIYLAFPSGYPARHYKFFFDVTRIQVATALRALSWRSEDKTLITDAVEACLSLFRSVSHVDNFDQYPDLELNIFRDCNSRKLDEAWVSPTLTGVNKAIEEFTRRAERICFLADADCKDKVSMYTWTTASIEKNLDDYLSDQADSFWTNNDDASAAFESKDWASAESLYANKAELMEAFLSPRRREDLSGVIAETRYNVAMAMWNADKRSEAVKALTDIERLYPQYTLDTAESVQSIAEVIKVFSEDKAALDRNTRLAEYRRLAELANDEFQSGNYPQSAELAKKAAAEYKAVTGDEDAFTLWLVAISYEGAEELYLANQYYRKAFEADPEYVFASDGKSMLRVWNEWRDEYAYKLERSAAEEQFEAKSWIPAFVSYSNAEKAALKIDKELGAESAYNAAMALMNADQWRRAQGLLRRIQREYPKYQPSLVREQIREIQSACPNQFLGC